MTDLKIRLLRAGVVLDRLMDRVAVVNSDPQYLYGVYRLALHDPDHVLEDGTVTVRVFLESKWDLGGDDMYLAQAKRADCPSKDWADRSTWPVDEVLLFLRGPAMGFGEIVGPDGFPPDHIGILDVGTSDDSVDIPVPPIDSTERPFPGPGPCINCGSEVVGFSVAHGTGEHIVCCRDCDRIAVGPDFGTAIARWNGGAFDDRARRQAHVPLLRAGPRGEDQVPPQAGTVRRPLLRMRVGDGVLLRGGAGLEPMELQAPRGGDNMTVQEFADVRFDLIEGVWMECDGDRLTMRDLVALMDVPACMDCEWDGNGVYDVLVAGPDDLEGLCRVIGEIRSRRGEDAIILHVEFDDPDEGEVDP